MRTIARINERIKDAAGHTVCIDESGRIWIVNKNDYPYKQLSLHDIGKLDSFGALEWIDAVAQISLLNRHDEMRQTIERGEAKPVEIRRQPMRDEAAAEGGKRNMLPYIAGVSAVTILLVSLFFGLAAYKAMPYLKRDAEDGVDITSRASFRIDGAYAGMAKYTVGEDSYGFVVASEGDDGLVDVYVCRPGKNEPVLVASDVAPKDLFTMAVGSLDGRYVSWGAKQSDDSVVAYLFDTKTMELSSYSVSKGARATCAAVVDLYGTVLLVVAGEADGSYEAIAYNDAIGRDGVQIASWSGLDAPSSVKPSIALSGKYLALSFSNMTYMLPYTSIKGMSIDANIVKAKVGGTFVSAAPSDSVGTFVIAHDGAQSVMSIDGKSINVKQGGDAIGAKVVDVAPDGELLHAATNDGAIEIRKGFATIASFSSVDECEAKGLAASVDSAYVVCQEGKQIVVHECKIPHQL